jgi:hypothetical protein
VAGVIGTTEEGIRPTLDCSAMGTLQHYRVDGLIMIRLVAAACIARLISPLAVTVDGLPVSGRPSIVAPSTG